MFLIRLGLCLLDIGGAPKISYNIMPPKLFRFSTSLKLPIGLSGASYYVRIMPDSRSSWIVNIMLQF